MCTYNQCFKQKYEKYNIFHLKIIIFTASKNRSVMHGHVFVMNIIANERTFDKRTHVNNVTIVHYDNMPMLYTAIFHGCKSNKFQMNIYSIFLIFA